MIDRYVARQPQQPGEERNAAVVVLAQRGHQLREDVLGDVLGLVVVSYDRADVAVDVVRVGDVEEPQRLLVAFLRRGPRRAVSSRGARVNRRAPSCS